MITDYDLKIGLPNSLFANIWCEKVKGHRLLFPLISCIFAHAQTTENMICYMHERLFLALERTAFYYSKL